MALAGQVKRCSWEPRHEWEARVRFVEDHVDVYGLEKAIILSTVWANMKFLGCRYPAQTEQMVNRYEHTAPLRGTSDAPFIGQVEQQGWNKGSENERKGPEDPDDYSYWDEEEEIDLADGEDTDPENGSDDSEEHPNTVLDSAEMSPATKQAKVNESDSNVSAQVGALISAVRKAQEGISWMSAVPAQVEVTAEGEESIKGAVVTPTMKSISSEVCICDKCTNWSECHRSSIALGRIFRQYHAKDRSRRHCKYRLKIETASRDAFAPGTMQRGVLEYNKKVIVEKMFKKATKLKTARLAIEIIHGYQEKYGRPVCPSSLSQPAEDARKQK